MNSRETFQLFEIIPFWIVSKIICKDYDFYNWMFKYVPRIHLTVYLLFQMILMSSLQLDKMQIRFLVAWILCWKLYNKCFCLNAFFLLLQSCKEHIKNIYWPLQSACNKLCALLLLRNFQLLFTNYFVCLPSKVWWKLNGTIKSFTT